MKHDPNIIAGLIGGLGAVLKGAKKHHKMRTILVNIIIGGLLAYLSMDLIPLFFKGITQKTSMLISFSIGYVANELTDNLESTLDVFFEAVKNKIKSFFK